MKVWKTDERGNVSPHDEPLRFVDCADKCDPNYRSDDWIHDLIEEEWPDNQVTWTRRTMRVFWS
mgnify:CR=1 FL=1